MPKETFETIISELDHEEDWRRMRATSTCMKGGPKAIEAIIQAMKTGSSHYKVEAVKMLARLRDPRAGLALAHALKDEDEQVRQAAVDALEHMAGILDEVTAAALFEHLQDDTLQERVTGLLGVIPTSIGPLSERLKDPDRAIRLRAAGILARLLDPRSADAFIDVMADSDLRDLASETLRKLGAIRARVDQIMDDLRAVDESELKEGVRQESVIQLHQIGRPIVEILMEYLEDDDWVVREAAADTLGKIGDIRAVEPLMIRLQSDKDTGVKEHALKSLGLIGDPRPVELFIQSIPIRPLRILAVEALEKVKDVEVLRPHIDLFARLKTDRDGLISYNSGVILDKLEAAAAQMSMNEEAWAEKETTHDGK
jgi:HEAT repeat protein